MQPHIFKKKANALYFEVTPLFRNFFFGSHSSVRSSHPKIPQAPPVPEEPLENLPRSNLICEICGRVFKTHSQLDRHLEHMHGHPEKTHIRLHTE
jgi:hypothetical protein